jgi:hypothetical protein
MEWLHSKDKVVQVVKEAQVVQVVKETQVVQEWEPQVEDKGNIEDLPLKECHQVRTLIKDSQHLIQEIYLEEIL